MSTLPVSHPRKLALTTVQATVLVNSSYSGVPFRSWTIRGMCERRSRNLRAIVPFGRGMCSISSPQRGVYVLVVIRKLGTLLVELVTDDVRVTVKLCTGEHPHVNRGSTSCG